MTGKKIDRRKKLIQLIHVAKSKLQMSDGDYRALLSGVGGKTSSAELTVAELERVFKALKSLGFA
ncbi:phage protein GemA/Gp16 family protein, partial [Treponema socranskii]|uniref:phage protein GemA/Gp16 family protein n=1 Tax=Treponema socranskii TaxID=53419 RepID=UPI003D8F0E50